jgi:hypothetical protein
LVFAGITVLGAVAWVAVFSPLRMRRFAVYDASRIVSFPQSGTYVLFEEGPGASQVRLPPPVVVSVIGEGGIDVPVDFYAGPGDTSTPPNYRVGPYEGRAFARFFIPRPGEYLVRIETAPPSVLSPGQYSAPPRGEYALGREITTTWLGSYTGVVVVAALPALAAAVAASVSRRQRRGVAAAGE